LPGGSTVFLSFLIIASVQLLGDDQICARPLENASGGTSATSVSGAFCVCGSAQLFFPSGILGRLDVCEPELPLEWRDGGVASLILFRSIAASLCAVRRALRGDLEESLLVEIKPITASSLSPTCGSLIVLSLHDPTRW
jgi:hypothetical protein